MVSISPKFDSLGLQNPVITYGLGIMGGTFDPIHTGHLACAEAVRESLGLDGILFIPAGKPWMKNEKDVTEAEHRYEMVKRAIADNPYFDVSRLEIDRPGETYTVDTLQALRAYFPPNVELFFITGADAVSHIAEWHNAEDIPRLAEVVACTRPGYEIDPAVEKFFSEHSDFYGITFEEVTGFDISSSDVRNHVRMNESIRYLTPQPVVDYINKQGLYR